MPTRRSVDSSVVDRRSPERRSYFTAPSFSTPSLSKLRGFAKSLSSSAPALDDESRAEWAARVREEFGALTRSLGVELSAEELEEIILKLDENGDGEIQFDELLEWWDEPAVT